MTVKRRRLWLHWIRRAKERLDMLARGEFDTVEGDTAAATEAAACVAFARELREASESGWSDESEGVGS
jgi:hypothetical protein